MNRFLRAWVAVCSMAIWIPHAGTGIYSNDFSSGIGAGVISGNAAIVSSRLTLTPNAFGTYGTLLLNELDPGRRVQSFTGVCIGLHRGRTTTPIAIKQLATDFGSK